MYIYVLPCAIDIFALLVPSLQAVLNPPFRGILLPTGIDAGPFPRMYERLLMIRGSSAWEAKDGIFPHRRLLGLATMRSVFFTWYFHDVPCI